MTRTSQYCGQLREFRPTCRPVLVHLRRLGFPLVTAAGVHCVCERFKVNRSPMSCRDGFTLSLVELLQKSDSLYYGAAWLTKTSTRLLLEGGQLDLLQPR